MFFICFLYVKLCVHFTGRRFAEQEMHIVLAKVDIKFS